MSSNGWGGADPTAQNDGPTATYELGTRYLANQDITITAVRVWHGPTSANVTGRKGRIWSSGGVLEESVDMAASLPSGWTVYQLASPIGVHAGTVFWVSYSTTQYYGAVVGAFSGGSVPSNDGLVDAQGQALNETQGSFPTSVFGASFYGIDIVYSAGLPGSLTASLAVAMSGLDAVATFGADRSSTYLLEWGDGATSAGSGTSASASHTYAQAGIYPVLLTATAGDGTVDAAAAIGYAVDLSSLDVAGIFNAAKSHAMSLGIFGAVNTHEPKNAPGKQPRCDIWLAAIDPVAARSGLAATSVRVTLNARIYNSMHVEPQDQIDPDILTATSTLMAAYTGDFDLFGTVAEVDLLGQYGVAMSARAGYLTLDQKLFRVMTITLPLIVNDVWTQVM